MIKAIFFDLDGTLIPLISGVISPATKAALETLRSKGILLFVATGRAPYELALTHMIDGLTFDGIVSLNGQYCYSGDTVIHRCPFDKEDLQQIISNAQRDNCPCVIVEKDDMYASLVNDHIRQAQEAIHTPLPRIQDLSDAVNRDVLMLMAYIPAGEAQDRVLAGVEHSQATRWNKYGIDIVPKGCSKKTGIDCMLQQFGLTWNEVMAFGDGENDYEMLKHAGIGVAMGNSCPLLLNGPFHVTADSDHDGVVAALKHFQLI